jgi:hypothetical protein
VHVCTRCRTDGAVLDGLCGHCWVADQDEREMATASGGAERSRIA